MNKTAILIGATGLIGRALLTQLLADKNYNEVKVITRRTTGVTHAKLTEIIADFDNLDEAAEAFKGDVLFSTLGTTLKTAGSKDRQYEIDYGINYKAAALSAKNKVGQLVLLSSAGANSKSTIFYSKMKGELDEAVAKLGFAQVSIIRPSMLTGDRKEFRWSEKLFTPIMHALCWVPGLRKYRPIKDRIVAKAMRNAVVNDTANYTVHEFEGVFHLAKLA